MIEQFTEIYDQNRWRHGSGEGSLPQHTKSYCVMLQSFLRKRGIKSVVDMGCGDWQFSQFIDWTGIRYRGFDVVRSVIDANRDRFASENISFDCYSGRPEDLPSADLLIAKDVLQHWSNRSIEAFLPHMKKYTYCLITNCVSPRGKTVNVNIEDGEFRPLDLRVAPFNVHATDLFTFTNQRPLLAKLTSAPRWRKKVLLIQNGSPSH